jgi:hypothetical protein
MWEWITPLFYLPQYKVIVAQVASPNTTVFFAKLLKGYISQVIYAPFL